MEKLKLLPPFSLGEIKSIQSCMNYLNALSVVADEGGLGPEVVHALLPALADAGVVLGVGSAA